MRTTIRPNFKRRMPDELGSGATLLQDKDFIAAGERR